jgi:hypothetical protein
MAALKALKGETADPAPRVPWGLRSTFPLTPTWLPAPCHWLGPSSSEHRPLQQVYLWGPRQDRATAQGHILTVLAGHVLLIKSTYCLRLSFLSGQRGELVPASQGETVTIAPPH